MTLRLINGKVQRRSSQFAKVTDCTDCGACCRHIGTPPGYAAFYPVNGEIGEWALGTDDHKRWLDLPPEVESELRTYYAGVQAGTLFDRSHGEIEAGKALEMMRSGQLELAAGHIHRAGRVTIPCLWYDEDAKRCRHYEHRPSTCRDAIEPGDKACLATRSHFRIPLPLAQESKC